MHEHSLTHSLNIKTHTLKTQQSRAAGIHGRLEGLEPEMNPDEYHIVWHSE